MKAVKPQKILRWENEHLEKEMRDGVEYFGLRYNDGKQSAYFPVTRDYAAELFAERGIQLR